MYTDEHTVWNVCQFVNLSICLINHFFKSQVYFCYLWILCANFKYQISVKKKPWSTLFCWKLSADNEISLTFQLRVLPCVDVCFIKFSVSEWFYVSTSSHLSRRTLKLIKGSFCIFQHNFDCRVQLLGQPLPRIHKW